MNPAAGKVGSPDKTGAATTQVDAFFGDAAPSDFGADSGLPSYDGPDEWSYRRFVLHYAKLAALAGGVDVFLLGSELRGLTTARDSATHFPAVDAVIDLAADVRSLVGEATTLTYAADWSEYFGHQPQDGSGDVLFHLDPLWADENIDVVGIDWYPPLSDWRDGVTHLDATLAPSIHDLGYLEGRIEAGEDYDFFYASAGDRVAQTRTTITDGAHSEPWIYRAKDVRNFWGRAHHDRPGGVRSAIPTAWVAEAKPVWFIELGCPAVDKGANAPNLFVDDKSGESALPPFSTGARDDLIQRRALEAYLRHWAPDAESNPISSLTGKPMIEEAFVYAWDARPHPAFPARTDVWSDGGAWRLGHWLNGRAGLSGLGEVVREVCARSGADDVDVSALSGAVSGFIVDAPAMARDALEPLMAAFDFVAAEREGVLTFFHADGAAPLELASADFTADVGDLFAERADPARTPVEARVRFLDPARDYLLAGVSARRLDRAEGGVATIEAPLVLETEAAELLAQVALADARAATEALSIALGPVHFALEPGDRVALGEVFEIARIEDTEARKLELRRVRSAFPPNVRLADPAAPPAPAIAPTPAFAVIDLPPLPGKEDDERPLVAVFASPWLNAHTLHAGANAELLTQRARVTQPAVMGELLWALYPGPVDRWDNGNVVRIKLYGGALASATGNVVLDGDNAFAIENGVEWEIIQARSCVLVGENEYELSGFLRGQLGSERAMASPHPVGVRIVKLDDKLGRADINAHEWNEPLLFVAPPAGALPTDARAAAATITLPHAAARPWAPAHLRAVRDASGDVSMTWVRCARSGGDAWSAGEPPLGAPSEAYLLEIMDGGDVVRSVNTLTPSYSYSAAEQGADFGALPGSLRFRVAQIDASGLPGLNKELTITL